MAGVLFIVNVPRRQYEEELRRKEISTKILIENNRSEKDIDGKEVVKGRKTSKASNIESFAQDNDNVILSKCKSTDCLNTRDKENGLFKSYSEDFLCDNENIDMNIERKSCLKSSWEDMKQTIKPRKNNKLKITEPEKVNILSTFQWNTPLETILSEVICRLDIKNAAWSSTKDDNFWQVQFSLESSHLCEELLQVLRTLGVGSRHHSSISVIPCALYYHSCNALVDSSSRYHRDANSAWSRFSSSMRARSNLAQVLHTVRAEAALTFDWLFLLIVAAFVAAIGLVEDSTVILVASMLISPLMVLNELLRKLCVEHVVWLNDKTGNYVEVIYPLATGDPCETMLHCLTKLGIGVRSRSIVSVLPCNVVHSAMERVPKDEETLLHETEEAKRWRNFVESIRSKLTVKQVVDGVRGGGELNFDYLTLIITADSLAALGLVENNASNIVAAMLVSPLMGPVMSITFGTIISDRTLVRSGFESLVVGMIVSLVFGFIFGLILGSTDMPWGFGDWPTEEMKSRGNVRSLWMGVLWALTSGTGVALALLQGAAGPLIGIAISASLLPPVVNCGLYWALACIWLLHPGVKIPHIKGEEYTGNSSYQPLYHDYLPIEFAVNGIVSCCLTIVNVICIFITAIMFLKIKEVAAPYTATPDVRRFWQQDIRVAREANRANLRAEDERTELVLDDLNQASEEEVKQKLRAAVEEALDDETYRKIKGMSYQSHNADEMLHSIGLQSCRTATPVSRRSSQIPSGSSALSNEAKGSNLDDIAALDKLLNSLMKENRSGDRRSQSFKSHRGTPRSSRMPVIDELRNRRSGTWPDSIFENSVVRNVINNLRRASNRTSPAEEPFLTPE